ncbi:hypothetical protein C0995_014327 [Termitomyces sp. Mi166|nr:hypothetical protein C0995_014327 [Termitomyces sp. Mi166\
MDPISQYPVSTYIIDDQDPTKVTYNGTWIKGGSPVEYNATVASSTNVGDYFTVSFKGTNIAVFVTFDITSGGVETTYSIDNSSPVTAVSQAGSGDIHRQQLWRSNTLAIGDHTLLVNMTKLNPQPSQPGEGTVWFDYFLVTDPTISITSSSTAPNPSQPAALPSSKGSRHIGVIVGGVIGGLFFLLGVAFLFLVFRRRTKAHAVEDKFVESSFSPDRHGTTIQPFRLTMPDSQAAGETSIRIHSNESSLGIMVSAAGSPLMASRKSVITTRSGTSHSTHPSIGNASTVLVSSNSEPLPSSSGSADINSAHHYDVSTERDKRRRHLQGDADIASQVNSPAPANENLESATLQHVDSGIRETDVGAEALAVRVELPPVYSPS